jgi:3-dehydroquinate dehydratase-2
MVSTIYIINGPNLNLLGQREPELYGRSTLADVEALCRASAERHGFAIAFRQSNHEGDIVDWLQEARQQAAGIVINPGAFTHTSLAILDAILAAAIPVVSLVSKVAKAVICGFGIEGYALAIAGLAAVLGTKAQS